MMINVNKPVIYLMLFSLLFFSTTHVKSALMLDRTRVVFTESTKAMRLEVSNTNTKQTLLAKIWIENPSHQKINPPLVISPSVQKIGVGAKAEIFITKTTLPIQLPKDRESLFYLNLRASLPVLEHQAVMTFALLSRTKLFFRPRAIEHLVNEAKGREIVFNKQQQGVVIENPTPFYITLASFSATSRKIEGKNLPDFSVIMLAPKSTSSIPVNINKLNNFYASFINDYGELVEMHFVCKESKCLTKDKIY